ncbi:hypothetical protein C9J01_19305 [Photobacterium rosenbergii]|uniref:Uncharacterized protein n=1 Tax=Photobacterium rosenbergii TaxID=294936 RepID=A0A2T3N9B7_9GAMM|nr:hypothetical protein [Photobacterium rosenbergii]PSW10011.1 hypothetical protein C9J01_19305 [Photobacterium rosenbergii]
MADNRYQIGFMLDFKARALSGEIFDHTVKEQIERYLVEPSDYSSVSYLLARITNQTATQ